MVNKQIMTKEEVKVWIHYGRRLAWAIKNFNTQLRRSEMRGDNKSRTRPSIEAFRIIIGLIEKELKDAQLRIQQAITQIEDPTFQKLLTSRYVLCKGWRDVAGDISYDIEYASTILHRRALRALEQVLNAD